MKPLAPYAFALLLLSITINVFSQNITVKPTQFSSYPDVINCPETELSKVFTTNSGQNITLTFSGNFIFSGPVISNQIKFSNLQSAGIKSPLFNNSILNISKRINADNSITYVGRIVNNNYADSYQLVKGVAGNYQLIKIETYKLIQDCALQ